MNTFKDILDLMRAEQGKFFVTDENGETVVVVLPFEEYRHLREGTVRNMGSLARRISQLSEQTEALNQEITKAQLQELPEDIFDLDGDESNEMKQDTVYIEPIES